VPKANKLNKRRTDATTLTQYGYSELGEVSSQSDATGATSATARRFKTDMAGRIINSYLDANGQG
jgi:hypothetical protein